MDSGEGGCECGGGSVVYGAPVEVGIGGWGWGRVAAEDGNFVVVGCKEGVDDFPGDLWMYGVSRRGG